MIGFTFPLKLMNCILTVYHPVLFKIITGCGTNTLQANKILLFRSK